jgi:glutaredoxin
VTVTIYTKPGCPYCTAARNDLIARGVDYVDVDVTTAPEGMEKLAELTLGAMQVPVIVDEDGSVQVAAGGG